MATEATPPPAPVSDTLLFLEPGALPSTTASASRLPGVRVAAGRGREVGDATAGAGGAAATTGIAVTALCHVRGSGGAWSKELDLPRATTGGWWRKLESLDVGSIVASLAALRSEVVERCERNPEWAHRFACRRHVALAHQTALLEDTLPKSTASELSRATTLSDCLLAGGVCPVETTSWDDEGDDEGSRAPGALLCQVGQHVAAASQLSAVEELSAEALVAVHTTLMHGSTHGSGDSDCVGGVIRTYAATNSSRTTAFPVRTCDDMLASLDELCREAERHIADASRHPVEIAAKLLHSLLALHPFCNGNGRLARMLFSYALSRCGCPVPVVLSSGSRKSRTHYGAALQDADGGKFGLLHMLGVASVHGALSDARSVFDTEAPRLR
uniref:Fido domain-containing protein n=1 Tax=Bicosoecida sp. CB-2014 TaxID=1486930 RepID=A0A7S1C7I0_9STRA|mmetsp:Transcript_14673/g.51084  ORF Transcript_14673/g.51084 Transcript_14673/m.51084 type:complete len:386 (+) Transcript_14673:198-1355(+)